MSVSRPRALAHMYGLKLVCRLLVSRVMAQAFTAHTIDLRSALGPYAVLKGPHLFTHVCTRP